MPFTISHVAAVLPFNRSRFCLPALAVGAMSPDFTYILEILGPSVKGHSIGGIFYFCLPVSWAIFYSYEAYLKPAWETLFPWIKGTNRAFSTLWVVLSILIGATTHVVWDSFTHRHGFAVDRLDFMRSPIFSIGSSSLATYTILQHVSTILGGLAVAAAVYRAIDRSDVKTFVTSVKTASAIVATIFLLAVFFCAPLLRELDEGGLMRQKQLVIQSAFRLLAATAFVAYAYPCFVWLRDKSRIRDR